MHSTLKFHLFITVTVTVEEKHRPRDLGERYVVIVQPASPYSERILRGARYVLQYRAPHISMFLMNGVVFCARCCGSGEETFPCLFIHGAYNEILENAYRFYLPLFLESSLIRYRYDSSAPVDERTSGYRDVATARLTCGDHTASRTISQAWLPAMMMENAAVVAY